MCVLGGGGGIVTKKLKNRLRSISKLLQLKQDFHNNFVVFVLDTGFHVFVWVGKEASSHEKGGGLMLAHVSSKKSIP